MVVFVGYVSDFFPALQEKVFKIVVLLLWLGFSYATNKLSKITPKSKKEKLSYFSFSQNQESVILHHLFHFVCPKRLLYATLSRLTAYKRASDSIPVQNLMHNFI